MKRPAPRITGKYRPFVGVTMRRAEGGVIEIRADDDDALARGLGFAHAHDRMLQMMLVRLAGRGQLSQHLQSSEETLAVDIFMRKMGFARGIEDEIGNTAPAAVAFGQAYCDGVNAYLDRHRRPTELTLVGYRPPPWTVADILLTIKIMSYIGLAQSQQDIEKLIIQAIHGGVDVARLKALFSPHLDGLDEEVVAAVRQLRHLDGLLPPEVRFLPWLPKVMASNNWAIAAARSASGSALQCNDPHLEANRLPAVWYEWIGHVQDDYRMGISMPGVPGLIMGRTRRLSAGFTYGFMDMIDYFVEEVVDGVFQRRGDQLVPLSVREEVIKRKGAPATRVRIYETIHGVLETDHEAALEDGFYLARAWSGQHDGAGRTLEGLHALLGASNVEQGQRAVRQVAISCNWLLADRDGRIAYQQSGLLPARQHSGLHPVLGSRSELDWRGMVDPESLSSICDPASGYLVTANNDVDLPGCAAAVNMPMGSYRAERIAALIQEHEPIDLEANKRIQRDLYSLQAERFMDLFRPLLPDTPAAGTLRDWDMRYDAGSTGAVLFERIYVAVISAVFGARIFGLEAWQAVVEQTAIITDYYDLFDRALLGDDPSWYGAEGRDALLRRVLEHQLKRPAESTWGEQRQVMMKHLLLGGKLPRWSGFDHGPITLEGGRATVVQGAIYRAHGRLTTFCPSYRYVTDLGTDHIETALAGGPSGRRTSRYYTSDVERWQRYEYKKLEPNGD